MIIGQSSPQQAALLAKAGRSTLDDVFRRSVTRRADAIALADPPNAAAVTGAAPRRLTFAQADRMITAVAGRLRHLGLQTDQIVALQMANTVDAVVALLGILRAGLIAMPLPLLWRQADCVAALNRVGARALMVSGRIGGVDHCELAMHVAAEVFPIRQVCGFGPGVGDGVIGFDELYEAQVPEPPPAITRSVNPAAHAAIITWDVGAEGPVPVVRNHFELLAAGAAVTLESRIEPSAVILSSLTLPSLAGLGLGLVPWLLIGGTLALHHPFDDAAFMAQCRAEQPTVAVVPAPLALRLGETEALSRDNGLKTVIAAWRAPERMASSPNWIEPAIGFVDVPVFGEAALFAARRGGNGRPAPLALGPVTAPRSAPGALQVIELDRTPAGTLAVRGPQVPRFRLPFELDPAAKPAFAVGPDGFADTGYPCTVDPASHAVAIAGAPAGSVGVGYRFGERALAELMAGTPRKLAMGGF
ncbi:MAG TPA: class I adenylate-forming enzyme family protein [Xanthobacteraceae bacterium]|nr:class I adenylate-forming enzyme family protein [Xanthobacteraceae bacterium]